MQYIREYCDRIMSWSTYHFPSLSGKNNMGCQKSLTHSAPPKFNRNKRPTLLRLDSLGEPSSDEDITPERIHSAVPDFHNMDHHVMNGVADGLVEWERNFTLQQPQPTRVMERYQKYMDWAGAFAHLPFLRYHPRMDPNLYPHSYGLLPCWQPPLNQAPHQQPRLVDRLSNACIGPRYQQRNNMKCKKPCAEAKQPPAGPGCPPVPASGQPVKPSPTQPSSSPLLKPEDRKTLDSVDKLITDLAEFSVSASNDPQPNSQAMSAKTEVPFCLEQLDDIPTSCSSNGHCPEEVPEHVSCAQAFSKHSSEETPTAAVICDNDNGADDVAPAVSKVCDNSPSICTDSLHQEVVVVGILDTASDSGIDTSADPIEDPQDCIPLSTPEPIKMAACMQTPHTVPKKKKKSRPSSKKRRQRQNRNEPLVDRSVHHQSKKQKTETSSSPSFCSAASYDSGRSDPAASVSVILGMPDEIDSEDDNLLHVRTKISFLISPSQSDSDDSICWDDDDDGKDLCFDDQAFELFASFTCSFTPQQLITKCASAPDLLDPNSIEAVNARWHRHYSDTSVPSWNPQNKPKVRFNIEPTVHPIIAWSYAYQAARKGPWEQYATDRFRFKNRIADVEKSIGHMFGDHHRARIFEERFSER